jgi:imidazolonepropionase-like amidohydrolase
VSIEHLGGQFLGILLGCSRQEAALHAEQATIVQALLAALEQGRPPAKTHLGAAFVRAVLDSYDDERASRLFSRFVQRGTWQCPTLVSLKTLWENEKEGLSEEDLAYGARVYAKSLEVVRAMHRAGVPFLAGTDGPYAPASSALHDELALLVEDGGIGQRPTALRGRASARMMRIMTR